MINAFKLVNDYDRQHFIPKKNDNYPLTKLGRR